MSNAFIDYMANTNNIIKSLRASMSVGYNVCDYQILIDIYIPEYRDYVRDITGVLRVKYEYPIYSTANNTCGNFTYISSQENYMLQVYGLNINSNTSNISPLFSVDAGVPLLNNGTIDTTIINF